MNASAFHLTAILLYLLSAGWLGWRLLHGGHEAEQRPVLVVAVAAWGLLAHAIGLYHGLITDSGLNFGVFNAASLVAWVVVALTTTTALGRSADNLLVVVLPLAAAAIVADMAFPSHRLLPESGSIGLQVHIMFSVLAFALITVAALQAVTLAIGERELRAKRPHAILRRLPPLQSMETLLFQLIAVGFFVLTLSLGSGFPFIKDLFAQHLAHKTVLAITAWVVFAVLLWGRHRHGWRGRTALRWTLTGFALLLLAYFGVKVVLELVLQRP